ncbi:MAG: enoyl-CoA hydratase-related protein [Rhodomicrobium sp.]
MRILLLTHSFNSLCQRLFVELEAAGHEVSVEFDINDAVTEEAVSLFKPDCLVAPFLKRAIPETVWSKLPCFIVHPGVAGDRGPSALDWAILKDVPRWGVTVLQAEQEMDAGPVWAFVDFPMREASKSSLYRNEVTEAAVEAVFEALRRFESGRYVPERARETVCQPAVTQADRAIDWERDGAAAVLRKIRSADGNPGVKSRICGRSSLYLYDAHPAPHLKGAPGEAIASSGPAVAVAAADSAIWIGHLRDPASPYPFKLPATDVLFRDPLTPALSPRGEGEEVAALYARGEGVRCGLNQRPFSPRGEGQDEGGLSISIPIQPVDSREGYQEIIYEEEGGAGFLHFRFYNGAMGSEACERLLSAYREALQRPTRVLVLMGGPDFWSNGMNLNLIEAASSPADASWHNIGAIDDLAEAILRTGSKWTVAALQGNAGAGGVFLARAADEVWLREGVVLSPHYKDMGNLYGSEFWTYSLPRHAGKDRAASIMTRRLPMGSAEAVRIGLADVRFGSTSAEFARMTRAKAATLAAEPELTQRLAKKQTARAAEEAAKPLSQYREEELKRMRLNFYGFDPSYHVARYNFVRKVPKSRTPVTIARHRDRRQPLSHRSAP